MLYRLSYAPAKTYITCDDTLYRFTGDIPASDIKPAHVDRRLAFKRKEAVSEATPARYCREVRSVLQWCVNHAYAKRDFSLLVTRKPKQSTEAARKQKGNGGIGQMPMFEQPDENPPLREVIEFYEQAHIMPHHAAPPGLAP